MKAVKKIPLFELNFDYTRSRGPGGQNVNKTNSAVILRWSPSASQILNEVELHLVLTKWKDKLNDKGEYLVRAETFREQEKNKKEAIRRLEEALQQALVIPKKRRPTKPSKKQKQDRLKDKRKRSEIKKNRREKIDY